MLLKVLFDCSVNDISEYKKILIKPELMKINQKYKVAILKTVKDKIKNNRILLFNFTSLSILQICNYIFPLITLPYLVRVLGPDHFGIVSFIIAFTGYFGMITDYGFNLSGTQTVSINRLDRNKLNSIYSSILFIKLFLFAVCIIVFALCLVSIDRFRADWLAYLAGFLSILGNVLFPIWLFMGLEKMKYVSMINIYMKILFTGSVFIFISNQNDTVLYLFLYSLHLVLIGVVGLFISFYKLKIKFIIPSKNELKYHFREGWYVFLSTFSISLYTISNTFILGLFASNEVVGYFAAADKIRGAVQGFYSAISQSVYPHLSALFVASKESALKFIKKLFSFVAICGTVTSLLTLLFADKIVTVFLGGQYEEAVLLLKIISFLPLIIMIGNVFGVQTLLNAGYKKSFTKILAFSAITNIIISFIFVPLYSAVGTTVIVMVIETLVTIGFYYELRKNNIHIFKQNYV